MSRTAMLGLFVLVIGTVGVVQPSSSSLAAGDPSCAALGAYGDMDGDGAAEGVVADPTAAVDGVPSVGQITIVHGRRESPVPLRTDVLRQGDGVVPGVGARGDHFGAAIQVGYLDGDECADVLVGVPGKKVDGQARAGAVVVLFGSDDGLGRGRPPLVWTESSFGASGVPERGDRFGEAMAVPTNVWVEFRAVALASPQEDVGGVVDAGAVTYALLGEDGFPVAGSARLITQVLPGLGDTRENGDRFGTAIALGSSRPELFVGTPHESVGDLAKAGVVDVVVDLGLGETPRGVRWTEADLGPTETVEADEAFGAALSYAVDGFTGISKLAIGAPGEDVVRSDAGRVYLIFDGPYEPPAERVYVLDQSDVDFEEQPNRGDRFGAALVTLPRYVTGTQTLLVIGVPGEDVDGARNAGLVHYISADSVGYYAQFDQNTRDFPGSAGADDHLGAVLGGLPSSGIDSPGAALIGLAADAEYPNGAVLVVPNAPIDESNPTEPRYDPRVWVPGRGSFPAGGVDFGAAATGASGDRP